MFAPDESILKEYRKTGDWGKYKKKYLELIKHRNAEKGIGQTLLEEGVVLLCSEAEPIHCHRRLAAEYLVQSMPIKPKVEIVHL